MAWQVSLSNQARKFLRDLRDERLRVAQHEVHHRA